MRYPTCDVRYAICDISVLHQCLARQMFTLDEYEKEDEKEQAKKTENSSFAQRYCCVNTDMTDYMIKSITCSPQMLIFCRRLACLVAIFLLFKDVKWLILLICFCTFGIQICNQICGSVPRGDFRGNSVGSSHNWATTSAVIKAIINRTSGRTESNNRIRCSVDYSTLTLGHATQ